MVTDGEKSFLIGLGGVLAFIATAVMGLWTSWTCLGDTKQVIVIMTVAAAVPALLFAWFWNRKVVAATLEHANAYEKLTKKSYWNPGRTVRLTASGETILLLGDTDSGVTVLVNVHNRCPLTLQPGTLTLTSWTLETEEGVVLFRGTDFHSNEFVTASLPPGEGNTKKIQLPVQKALPRTGPMGGVRFRCDLSLAYTVESWGPNTATSGSAFQSLVKDVRTTSAATAPVAAVGAALPGLDEAVKVTGERPGGQPWTFEAPMRTLINILLTDLLKPDWESTVRATFATALARKAGHDVKHGHEVLVKIADDPFNIVRAQLMARDLIRIGNQITTQGAAVVWHITDDGKSFQVHETIRASRSSQSPDNR